MEKGFLAVGETSESAGEKREGSEGGELRKDERDPVVD